MAAMTGSLITDRVKQLVRMRGPLIPSQISKEIGTNILMASAILSELASKGDVRISNVKIGGTPLYYVQGQEQKLQNYTSNMHQKEKEAYEQLKESGVLKDAILEPVIRVALRQIKDFAKPIEANSDGNVELFWKWYLMPNEEAETAIKKMLGYREEAAAATASATNQAAQKPMIEPVAGTQTTLTPQQSAIKEPMPTTAATTAPAALSPTPKQQLQQPLTQPIPETVQKRRRQQPTQKATAPDNLFAKELAEFFTNNNIEIETDLLAAKPKKSEKEYIVLLSSSVGKLRHYCIAKSKKIITDADVSSALVQGQLKKLPVMLLIKGELSKRAQELLAKDVGAVIVKKI
ncbi:hypothetical protein HYU16_02445 [Candidatus Woesearchaeota archaeon]|nr:hypothetical protein [Candidatus Woesearchaeota archaeon]